MDGKIESDTINQDFGKRRGSIMKKPKKKLVIGVGAVAVVAVEPIAVLGNSGKEGETLPKVEVVEAVTGDVQQTVEASGTVVSEEEKTYFSPANAKVDQVSFKEGETVKAGTKLVEFNMKDLEREEKKAELNVKSGSLICRILSINLTKR